jgi:hypothetical protein
MEWHHFEMAVCFATGALAGLGWGVNLGRKLYRKEAWRAVERAFRFLQEEKR